MPMSLMYDFGDSPDQEAETIDNVAQVAEALTAFSDSDRKNKAPLFHEIVARMRTLTSHEFLLLAEETETSMLQVVNEALPYVNTEASTLFMIRKLLEDNAEDNIRERWLSGLKHFRIPSEVVLLGGEVSLILLTLRGNLMHLVELNV